MEVGLVRKVDIDREMQQSYLDFAMSVIVARALPDARDGLKPVQRRILYAMYDMGLRPDSAYKKSARIVGEVLGKYHPHGDMAVYEAMARLAQDFSMRYPLVDGQGNFGSVDGDSPAAMRYTEARLKPFAIDILSQLDRDTVNFIPNFDESIAEPLVLPAALPNLLVNGSTGIAVGMATNIPPHNLSEVIDALAFMLEQWEKLDDINVSDLMRFIKGPDFPTGGIILQDQSSDLLTAYATGKGRVLVRGRVHIEDTGRGRSRLIITELPYMANKASLIERIAELVREGDLEGIADLRDESDRQGMRIVIELKSTSTPEEVLLSLYRRTPLESTLGITLLALVDGEPRLLSLKQALRVYLEHRLVVIRRRSEFDLAKAKARAHFLEGLRIALANLDEIIKLIRAAPDVDQARERLMKRFKLSEIQATAILDMPLRRLAALERKKIEDEYKEVLKTIKELESLLKSPRKMREVAETELRTMKETYGDRRRTQIVSLREGETAKMLLTTTDMTPAEETWVGISADGLIARLREGQPQGGDSGAKWSTPVGGRQAPRWILRTNTHHTLYLVSDSGQAAAIAVHALPEAETAAEGVPLHKASPLAEGDRLAGVFSVPQRNGSEPPERYVLTVSAGGLVKKSLVADLPGPSSQRFVLVKVNQGDRLVGLTLTAGNDELLLVTARGMAIRFSEAEVRPMGLVAAGVNGIKLAVGDQVAAFDKVQPDAEALLLASDGAGWRIPLADFPLQGRYGSGVTVCKLSGKSSLAGLLVGKPGHTGLVHYEKAAAQPVKLEGISLGKRQSAGKPAAPARAGDELLAVTVIQDGLGYWNPELALQIARTKKTPSRVAAKPALGKAPALKGKPAPTRKPSGETTAAKKITAPVKKVAATAKTAVKAVGKPAAAKAAPAKTSVKKKGAIPAAPVVPTGKKAAPKAQQPPTDVLTKAAPPAEKKSRGKPTSAAEQLPLVPVAEVPKKAPRQKSATTEAPAPAESTKKRVRSNADDSKPKPIEPPKPGRGKAKEPPAPAAGTNKAAQRPKDSKKAHG